MIDDISPLRKLTPAVLGAELDVATGAFKAATTTERELGSFS